MEGEQDGSRERASGAMERTVRRLSTRVEQQVRRHLGPAACTSSGPANKRAVYVRQLVHDDRLTRDKPQSEWRTNRSRR